MSLIPVRLTSFCDSHFELLNISFYESKLDSVALSPDGLNYSVTKTGGLEYNVKIFMVFCRLPTKVKTLYRYFLPCKMSREDLLPSQTQQKSSKNSIFFVPCFFQN